MAGSFKYVLCAINIWKNLRKILTSELVGANLTMQLGMIN